MITLCNEFGSSPLFQAIRSRILAHWKWPGWQIALSPMTYAGAPSGDDPIYQPRVDPDQRLIDIGVALRCPSSQVVADDLVDDLVALIDTTVSTVSGMTLDAAYDAVEFFGDEGQHTPGHDLHKLVAAVLVRLPFDVRAWFLGGEVRHVFIGGHGQNGQYWPLQVVPTETGAPPLLRLIFLAEHIRNWPEAAALWVIAHEIAHSRHGHRRGDAADERQADELVRQWGFGDRPR